MQLSGSPRSCAPFRDAELVSSLRRSPQLGVSRIRCTELGIFLHLSARTRVCDRSSGLRCGDPYRAASEGAVTRPVALVQGSRGCSGAWSLPGWRLDGSLLSSILYRPLIRPVRAPVSRGRSYFKSVRVPASQGCRETRLHCVPLSSRTGACVCSSRCRAPGM